MSNKNILIAPLEIAGYYANLTNGFLQLGVSCDFITFESHPFGYGGETKRPYLLKLSDQFKKKSKNNSLVLGKFFYLSISKIARFFWSLFACFQYDVFIFSYGTSLLKGNIDLLIIRLLGKKIISNLAHGSEARPIFIDGFYLSNAHLQNNISVLKSNNVSIKKRVNIHFMYSSLIIGAPFSTSYFAESKFINSFCLGLPFSDSEEIKYEFKKYNSYNKNYIRILHSPSSPVAKGTYFIQKAIERLKQKGYPIEFITIHGKSFQEVINEIQLCDFVVDQLYSDTPMAGFATEAAWFGKPAVVGGYGLEALKEFIPTSMWPPSFICLPDEIESAIEAMITNHVMRDELGSAAQAFVKGKWNNVDVAKRYLRIINDDIPDSWWVNPNKCKYLFGAGQSADKTKKNIRDLVSKYGKSSLQLTDKPDLEDRLISFSKEVN